MCLIVQVRFIKESIIILVCHVIKGAKLVKYPQLIVVNVKLHKVQCIIFYSLISKLALLPVPKNTLSSLIIRVKSVYQVLAIGIRLIRKFLVLKVVMEIVYHASDLHKLSVLLVKIHIIYIPYQRLA